MEGGIKQSNMSFQLLDLKWNEKQIAKSKAFTEKFRSCGFDTNTSQPSV